MDGEPHRQLAGDRAAMSSLKEVVPVTKAPNDLGIADKAGYALNDRRFIMHLKFLTIMQRVIVGQRIELLDEDKDQLYLRHLHLLHLAPRKDLRRQSNCRAPTLQEWIEVEHKIIALEK